MGEEIEEMFTFVAVCLEVSRASLGPWNFHLSDSSLVVNLGTMVCLLSLSPHLLVVSFVVYLCCIHGLSESELEVIQTSVFFLLASKCLVTMSGSDV